MSQRKPLLEIEYHSDDETGMYKVGEIDFGINGGLDEYLEHYGYEGKKEIVATLGYLIYEVENRFRNNKFNPVGTTGESASLNSAKSN
jgi:hypothetical protein